MAALDCTLLTDGSSDAVLLPILKWVVRQHAAGVGVNCEWADMRQLPRPPRTLADRVIKANEIHPCQVLFVHRDAESQPSAFRYAEVEEAVAEARRKGFRTPHICVVPVRMQEAWLLLDEAAIRLASGNPNGRMLLNLPDPGAIERIADPKNLLHGMLTSASGLQRRRKKKFRPGVHARLVAERMRDFACLRGLPAFQRLENDVEALIANLHLDASS